MSEDSTPPAKNINNIVPVVIKPYRPLYAPPIQRQRWDEPEGHTAVPWNDVFFDLFYVGGAYNLANIIVNNPTGEGLLYFCGCFWAVHTMWLDGTFFDAKFVTQDDIWHVTTNIIFYLVVATAILHVRPVDLMSVPSVHIDMFAFSLACVLANLFSIWRYLEFILVGKGEKAAYISSKREVFSKLVPTAFYLAATVVSGVEYYGNSNNGEEESTNVPIILLCCAALEEMIGGFLYLQFCFPKDKEKRKQVSIPTNTDYLIHRFGEWTMLILGESILSLLIVEVVSKGVEYYITFYTGIVSVCLLMYLYFISGPTHAEEHAMHRHARISYSVTVLMQFYSAGLVLLGATYKLFMYEYTYENFEDEFGVRRLVEYIRLLAGKGLGDFEESARRQQIAYFFSFSLGLVWACSDILMLMHKGLYHNIKRLYLEDDSAGLHKIAVLLTLARTGLLAFIATLCLYLTDPHHLAAIGMCCIFAQCLLRVAGDAVFPHKQDEEDDDSDDGLKSRGVEVSMESGGLGGGEKNERPMETEQGEFPCE